MISSKVLRRTKRRRLSQILIHNSLFFYIVNMPFYRLQIRKEIEIKYILQYLM